MARRTPQQWQKLIHKQAASGQTAAAFFAARGIMIPTTKSGQ